MATLKAKGKARVATEAQTLALHVEAERSLRWWGQEWKLLADLSKHLLAFELDGTGHEIWVSTLGEDEDSHGFAVDIEYSSGVLHEWVRETWTEAAIMHLIVTGGFLSALNHKQASNPVARVCDTVYCEGTAERRLYGHDDQDARVNSKPVFHCLKCVEETIATCDFCGAVDLPTCEFSGGGAPEYDPSTGEGGVGHACAICQEENGIC